MATGKLTLTVTATEAGLDTRCEAVFEGNAYEFGQAMAAAIRAVQVEAENAAQQYAGIDKREADAFVIGLAAGMSRESSCVESGHMEFRTKGKE